MQVTETQSEGLKRGYTIIVPAGDIESRRNARLADLGRTLRIPGFRPGKVPLPVVRQRYGAAVTAEVLEQSVNEATQQLLSDRGLRPATQPRVDVVSPDPGGAGPAKDLEFKVELELLPEIPKPDFSAIHLTRYKAEVAPEAVDRSLAELAKRQGTLVDETDDRGAEPGDLVTVDFTGKIDGEPFEGGHAQDSAIEVGGPGFIPGFTEQMAGLRLGETRTITVTFPEDYPNRELAGKAATFDVTAKKLQRRVIPGVNDELATKLGFDDLAELRETLTRRLRREYDELSRVRLKRDLLDALAAHATFAAPQGMVGAEFDQIWRRFEADRQQGRLDEDDKGKDEETLKAEYRAIADRRVRLGLLLAEIGSANGISVSSEEMSRAMRTEAGRYVGQEQKVMEFFRKNPQAAENLRGPIFEEKVVDYILELAGISEQTVTAEELAKGPDRPTTPAEAGAPQDEAKAAEVEENEA